MYRLKQCTLLCHFSETVYPSLKDAKVVGTYSGLRYVCSLHRGIVMSFPLQISLDLCAHVSVTYRCILWPHHRPSTQHRDYRITAFPEHNWITVGGIRSTGLTASAGIGEYVSDLYEHNLRPNTNSEDMLGVTEAAASPVPSNVTVCNPKVPTLTQLAESYKRRGDGKVEVYEGTVETVTHPISIFGMSRENIES